MGIPTIQPYPMPTEAELAPSVATWRPERHRAVLLVHDMQRYFVDFLPSGRPPVTELLSNVARLRQTAATLEIPVVYTAQPSMSRDRRGLLCDVWGSGMADDPDVRRIVAEAGQRPGDLVLDKFRYSAFHDSNLAELLAAAGRDQLVVCGVYAHIGCLITASDAFARDIETFLVADAVADFSLDHHRMALDYAARLCAVTMTTRQLLSCLADRHPVAR